MKLLNFTIEILTTICLQRYVAKFKKTLLLTIYEILLIESFFNHLKKKLILLYVLPFWV